LIIADEDNVSHKDEEKEVAYKDINLLREIKSSNGNVESHYYEAKHHLIHQNKIEYEINSIDFKCKYFE